MTKLSYVRLVTSFVKSLTHFVGVYGGVAGVKAIPGDPRGETFICRYPTGFVDFKRPAPFTVRTAMDFVKIASFQSDVVELLSRFVLFPNEDRLVL